MIGSVWRIARLNFSREPGIDRSFIGIQERKDICAGFRKCDDR